MEAAERSKENGKQKCRKEQRADTRSGVKSSVLRSLVRGAVRCLSIGGAKRAELKVHNSAFRRESAKTRQTG